eukprot:Skav212768  [mRNA]  locus=scaffold159:7020:10545:- [translate_table: standard]
MTLVVPWKDTKALILGRSALAVAVPYNILRIWKVDVVTLITSKDLPQYLQRDNVIKSTEDVVRSAFKYKLFISEESEVVDGFSFQMLAEYEGLALLASTPVPW